MNTPPHFLVIVPGFMGSKLVERETGETVWLDLSRIPLNPLEWEAWLERLFERLAYPNDDLVATEILDEVLIVPPWSKQEEYSRLFSVLGGLGYIRDGKHMPGASRPLYTFPYDWRQDNRLSARQLGEALAQWSDENGGAKAWVICHSNGGAVVRWLIDRAGGAQMIERVIYMASPWDGAPKAMAALWDGLEMLIRRRFDLFDIPERSRNLLRSFPSLYQLIPTRLPFLTDEARTPVDPFAEVGWLRGDRAWSALLRDGARFNRELLPVSAVEAVCFLGRKRATLSAGLVDRDSHGNWKNIRWMANEPGDGTIPVHSAVCANARSVYPFPVGHGEIYVNPAVLDVLEWELAGKYRAVKGQEPRLKALDAQLMLEKDVFLPGEKVLLTVTVQSEDGTAQGAGAQVQLVWRAPLPAQPMQKALHSGSGVRLSRTPGLDNVFSGALNAPAREGYYEVRVAVTKPGRQTCLMSELIIVEADAA